MSATISSTFGGANGGVSGATITAWKPTRFLVPPVQGSALPSGTPTGGPVTSGPTFGSAGGYQLSVPQETSYWVCATYNDVNYWSLFPVDETTAQVASVFGRTGTVSAQNGDYTATKISGLGSAAKKNVGAATGVASLNSTGKIPAGELPSQDVTSVFGRTGAVTAEEGDYTVSLIAGLGSAATRNAGSATGVASLNSSGKVPATESQVQSVFGRTGIVVGGITDYKTVEMRAKSIATTLSGTSGRLVGKLSAAPGSGTWLTGDYGIGFATTHVVVVTCTAGGTPGTWHVGSIISGAGSGTVSRVASANSSLTITGNTGPTVTAEVATSPKIAGVAVTGTAAAGKVPVATGSAAATWQTFASILLKGIVTAAIATTQTTTSTTYTGLTTAGPAETVTTGAHALVIVTAFCYNATAFRSAQMSYAVSGASTIAASNANGLNVRSAGATEWQRLSVVSLITVTAGSNTFTAMYSAATGGTAHFRTRSIIVVPLP